MMLAEVMLDECWDVSDYREPEGENPLEDLLTVNDAAKVIGLTPGAVARAIQTKRLAAWKKGNVYLIPRGELAKWTPYQGRGRKKKQKGPEER